MYKFKIHIQSFNLIIVLWCKQLNEWNKMAPDIWNPIAAINVFYHCKDIGLLYYMTFKDLILDVKLYTMNMSQLNQH